MSGAFGLAQPDRILGQRVEDRLEVEGGPPDHLEQLAGRRLLLEGDAQLAVACAQLGEQPHVLDGDDGLVGEGLEQRNLPVGEGQGLGAAELDHADGSAIPQQGNTQQRPVAEPLRVAAALRELTDLGLHVGNVDSPRLQHTPTGDGASGEGQSELADRVYSDGPMMGDEEESVACEPEDGGILGLAEAARAGRHGVEYRLDVNRRAADDLEDLGGGRLLLEGLGELRREPVAPRPLLLERLAQRLDFEGEINLGRRRHHFSSGAGYRKCPESSPPRQGRSRRGARPAAPGAARSCGGVVDKGPPMADGRGIPVPGGTR